MPMFEVKLQGFETLSPRDPRPTIRVLPVWIGIVAHPASHKRWFLGPHQWKFKHHFTPSTIVIWRQRVCEGEVTGKGKFTF